MHDIEKGGGEEVGGGGTLSLSAPVSIRSTTRPGVPTATSTPRASAWAWGPLGTPP